MCETRYRQLNATLLSAFPYVGMVALVVDNYPNCVVNGQCFFYKSMRSER